MRYFLDSEFVERGNEHPIELISIALVSDDGREYYACNSELNLANVSKWLWQNVMGFLPPFKPLESPLTSTGNEHTMWKPKSRIANEIRIFCDPVEYGKPEFWAWYADYDWVVLCQLFGDMINLPPNWPMYCKDLKQWADDVGNPRIPKQETIKHSALEDARHNRVRYEFLSRLAHEQSLPLDDLLASLQRFFTMEPGDEKLQQLDRVEDSYRKVIR